MYAMANLDHVPAMMHVPHKLDADDAVSAVRDYTALTGLIRSRMCLSLERFGRAMARFASVDKALDLAIAMESMLTDGSGENTFKLALRAGLLTEGGPKERLRARAVFGAIPAAEHRRPQWHRARPSQVEGRIRGGARSSRHR